MLLKNGVTDMIRQISMNLLKKFRIKKHGIMLKKCLKIMAFIFAYTKNLRPQQYPYWLEAKPRTFTRQPKPITNI